MIRRHDSFGEEAALSPKTFYVASAFSTSYTSVCHIGVHDLAGGFSTTTTRPTLNILLLLRAPV